ncbi:MAG TPA: selenocysteine-specific translation elongation factor [Eggerthellaceae bacterium]|nr:selenocysteine-specific translation elongation factor [Eggerthellaceae bacterium]
MEASEASRRVVLGTAGHIDHGKSALVLALTGTDPDRLAEEKARGITIELGFAQLVLPDGTAMGVVDVPGHERFVRQMISGSTGIDLALLCIAADDGVMPQTREHLAVIDLLGIDSCIVALTKCDRVDDEWRDLVLEDVREWLATTRFANAPIVPTSARTGAGLDALKQELMTAAHAAESQHRASIVRMPVDRVFTMKGAGTVVTGTLWSGTIALEDELQILPAGQTTRARAIQIHGTPVQEAPAGNRVAVNLADAKTTDVRPGDFLATPGAIVPSDRFDCWFTYASPLAEGKPLASGTRVRVAHGTRETFGRILFMNGQDELQAHEGAYAQIRLEEELALSWQDRFVVRSYSPVRVIGGGSVLAAHPRRRTTLSESELALLDALREGDADEACTIAISLQDAPLRARDLAELMGTSASETQERLGALARGKQVTTLQQGSMRFYTTPRALQKGVSALENALLKFHAEQPDALGVAKGDLLLRSGLRMDAAAFDALLARALDDARLVVEDGIISHPQAGAGARQKERQNADRVAGVLAAAGATPPSTEELAAQADMTVSALARALATLEREDRAVRIDRSLAFDARAFAQLRDAAIEHIRRHGPSSAADLKDAMGRSRKYAIPILEHLDRTGATVRDGDLRRLP